MREPGRALIKQVVVSLSSSTTTRAECGKNSSRERQTINDKALSRALFSLNWLCLMACWLPGWLPRWKGCTSMAKCFNETDHSQLPLLSVVVVLTLVGKIYHHCSDGPLLGFIWECFLGRLEMRVSKPTYSLFHRQAARYLAAIRPGGRSFPYRRHNPSHLRHAAPARLWPSTRSAGCN